MQKLPFRQIHLDFHTSEKINDIALNFDPQEFAETLKAARVNSITCFSRCHHGMIYHDTKFIDARHPNLRRNLLAEQIEVCHKNGIRIPIYITVGLDEHMSALHPEWIEINCDGVRSAAAPLQPGWHKLCLNHTGAYIDYVIEQTEEVLDMFGAEVDGLFFDIISQGQCCCRTCMKGMIKGGYNPENPEDRQRFSTYTLNSFKERMTDAVRAKNKDCAIFYNAGHVGPYIRSSMHTYTHLELESLPSGGWGYEHFPITARYARYLGLESSAMTGKFLKSWGDFGGFKTPAALEYECFTALSLGCACGVGDQLHPSGKLAPATYDLIGKVYRQVEKKEPWCIGIEPVTEIGIITPEVVNPGHPGGVDDSSAGVYHMLKEHSYQYDYIDFDMDLSRYKVIVLPDVIRLKPDQASKLNSYVAAGGKILASYHSGMGESGFGFVLNDMPAAVKGDSEFSPDFLVAGEEINDGIAAAEYVMYERGLELHALPDAKSLAEVWKPYFNRTWEHYCSHSHTPVEGPAGYPGIVANEHAVYVGYPIFAMYKRHGARVYRDMVVNALKLLMPDDGKLVNTNAPTTLETTLNYQPEEDRYVLHALHYIPERRHSTIDIIEDVIPIYDVKFDLLFPDGYNKARIEPDGIDLDVTRSGDRLQITIPEIRGHTMVSFSK
ncbi:MAG: alpha-amylase family protein [Armatimonadota bacterium]